MQKRRGIRWRINHQAGLRLEGAHAYAACYIKDINFFGAQIALKIKLPIDSFVKLSLMLSEGCILELEVWVSWHKIFNGLNLYGIYFSTIKDSDKEKIYQFLRRDFSEQVNLKWWENKEKGGDLMLKQENEDKRIFARLPCNFSARILDLTSNKETEAKVHDISAKGVGFTSPISIKPMAALELLLDIPDQSAPFYTRGEAVWASPADNNEFRIGVNLEKADLIGLARVLRV